MAMYRGQTSTMQKIQAVSTIKITTPEEAIAFLRAISNIEVQIAGIIQRQSLQAVSARNQSAPKPIVEEAEKAQEVPAETSAEETVTFDDDEEHTEEQKVSMVERLKGALGKK